MKTKTQVVKSFASRESTIIIPIFEDASFQKTGLKDLDVLFSGKVKALMKDGIITGKKGSTQELLGYGKTAVKRVIIVGLGKEEASASAALRYIAGQLGRNLQEKKEARMTIALPETVLEKITAREAGQSIAEGLEMGLYQFKGYQKKKEKKTGISELVVKVLDKELVSEIDKGLNEGVAIAAGVNTARDLGNTPANILTPKEIVERAKALEKKYKSMTMEVLDKKKAEALGMNAFLGVAQGSAQEPYMLILRYDGATEEKMPPIAWVGKGVTFDSGGISIKPSKGMSEMKGDMGGAAAVFGAMQSIAKLKPKCKILAIMPLVENMPSANAQRPGDVVTAMNGKSIEITNTDAEGRLILADALCYAVKEKPAHIVDLATLTGAALVALGNEATAIMGNKQELIDAYRDRAEVTDEKLWQLPLYDAYLDYLKSDVADLINANENRLAGTCTAGKFLEQFVDKTPWIHLDIAPTMSNDKTRGADVKGMSGAGVRTLVASVCG